MFDQNAQGNKSKLIVAECKTNVHIRIQLAGFLQLTLALHLQNSQQGMSRTLHGQTVDSAHLMQLHESGKSSGVTGPSTISGIRCSLSSIIYP